MKSYLNPIQDLKIKAYTPDCPGGYTLVPVYRVFHCPVTNELLAVTPYLHASTWFEVTHWRTGFSIPCGDIDRANWMEVVSGAVGRIFAKGKRSDLTRIYNGQRTLNELPPEIKEDWIIKMSILRMPTGSGLESLQ